MVEFSFPSGPLQELHDPHWRARGIRLWIKRDDLTAPSPGDPFCGNKYRKLKYNLAAARAAGQRRLLTFGGPWSNHIAAVAAAGRRYGFDTTGVIRGEPVRNPTLDRAAADGMQLHFVDRATYRRKHEPEQLRQWEQQFGPALVLPEGGTNAAALRGCAELMQEITAEMEAPPDYAAVACGTGGTAAGLILGASPQTKVIGFSVLKGEWMAGEIAGLLPDGAAAPWSVDYRAHCGGYAKRPPELVAYMKDFHQRHGLRLDGVYTGKMMRRLEEKIATGCFPAGSRIVAIHTGGLQAEV